MKRKRIRALTILELLVSMTVLMVVAGLSYSILSAATSAWKGQQARANAFEGARTAFELLTNRLSQATLNTYWDYDDPGAPTAYLRMSELHFVQGRGEDLIPDVDDVSLDAVFFVAPLGFTSVKDNEPLVKMLTACGLYVRFSDDPSRPPFLDGRVPSRFRYRLYQYLQPGEMLSIYREGAAERSWFRSNVEEWSFPMVDNVIGLIFRAHYPTAAVSGGQGVAYDYDTRAGTVVNPLPTFHQLPTTISVTMVVIDEDSARQLADRYGTSPPPILPSATAFTNVNRYEEDMAAWEEKLRGETGGGQPSVKYRVLSAEIPLRGAKWSTDL